MRTRPAARRPEKRNAGAGDGVGVEQDPNEEEGMPLQGEYAPSTSKWARDQAETYEATKGREANSLRGKPVIVLTTVGAKSVPPLASAP